MVRAATYLARSLTDVVIKAGVTLALYLAAGSLSGAQPNAKAGAEPRALVGITSAHNAVRAAVGVAPLSWDERLAATAQAWANTCTDADHDGFLDGSAPADRSAGHPWYVGENLYFSTATANAQAAVKLWAAEKQHYDHDHNRCARGKVCGDYTQMVWAYSTHLGCGISTCPNLTYHSTIVCDYGPGGNIAGRSPY